MDAFIGEIRAFANSFYPYGWYPCLGQRVPLDDYSAPLFSIIQTLYGPSDMRTYFTLPDLRGKALVGAGGPLGLPLGKTTGEYSVILDSRDLPKHSHSFSGAWSADKDSYLTSPERNQTSFLGNFGFDGGTAPGYVGEMENDVVLDSSSIAQNGSNLPHNNMAPFLTINYYICSEGYYPPKP